MEETIVQLNGEQLGFIAEGVARCSAGVWFFVGCWLYGVMRDAIAKGW